MASWRHCLGAPIAICYFIFGGNSEMAHDIDILSRTDLERSVTEKPLSGQNGQQKRDYTERVLVLDFGGQYNQLIARRIREQHVFADIRPAFRMTPEIIRAEGYRGIVFTGGPNSVYAPGAPTFDPAILELGIPILGICYGHQLLTTLAGGTVVPASTGSEYGNVELFAEQDTLLEGFPEKSICWMSHTDTVRDLPAGFRVIARTEGCAAAAIANPARKLYGVQFHPEVTQTACGKLLFRNFLFSVCGCSGDWRMEDFAQTAVRYWRQELAGQKVLCALSGGVDSAVAAALIHRAIGDNLTCVFVDHGLLRLGEADEVERIFAGQFGMNLRRIKADDRFLSLLAGVTDPEEKRKRIGEAFIRTFEDVAGELGHIPVLAQGTIYPDVIESGDGTAATIKSHHNVGGLPAVMDFKRIVEPLRALFKDEVRALGLELGLPASLVNRQPFPGPGLAVRITGEVTWEKLELLRQADAILREEVSRAGLEREPDQFFAVLTDTRSVGVKGDARLYGVVAALRAVTTEDFMTADFTRLPWDLLARVSSRITNEIQGISRVVYDITSKPPATVEWE